MEIHASGSTNHFGLAGRNHLFEIAMVAATPNIGSSRVSAPKSFKPLCNARNSFGWFRSEYHPLRPGTKRRSASSIRPTFA